jgi:hypothetical protein
MAISHFLLEEEWHRLMYDYLRSTSYNAVFFWIILMVTGNLLIMKLFVAIFINNYIKIFAEVEEKDKIEDDFSEDMEESSDENKDL